MVKRRRTYLGYQEVQQNTQEHQVHGCGKWRRKKNIRAGFHNESQRFMCYSGRPDFLISVPTLPSSEWHFIWYANDYVLWSLLSMTLQILKNIILFWEAPSDMTTRGRTGPYYALKLWHTERMSPRHIAKIRSSTLTLCSKRDVVGELEQAAFQRMMYEKEKKARLLDVETYVEEEVWQKRIRVRNWLMPTGIQDGNWKHWKEFQYMITKEFHGWASHSELIRVGWKRLCELCESSHAFPSSVRGSISNERLGEVSSRLPIELSSFASSSSSFSAPCISDPIRRQIRLSCQHYAEHVGVVKNMRSIHWLGEVPASHMNDVHCIKRLFFDKYYANRAQTTCDIVVDDEFPTSVVAWLAVCEQCMDTIRYRKLWPKEFRQPYDHRIRPFANAAPYTFYDPGNPVLEILWFALRFYRHVDDYFVETMLAPGLTPYGQGSQKSSKGITNFRGNIIEGIISHTADIATCFV